MDAVQKALAPIVEIHKPIIMVTAVILSVHGWELRLVRDVNQCRLLGCF